MKTSRWAWVWAAAALALGACAFAAADPPSGDRLITFHRQIKDATSSVFDRVIQMDVKSTDQADGSAVQATSSQVKVHFQGRLTVTAVTDGLPSAMRIAFATDNDSSFSVQGGAAQHQPFPFSGRTVNIQRLDDGKIGSDYQGRADPGAIQQMGSLLELDGGMLPDKPVAIGQEWDADTATVRRTLQLGPDDHGSIHCRLISVTDDPAGPTAQVEVTQVEEQHPSPGASTKMVLKGTADILLSTGQAMVQELAGQVDIQGVRTQRGQDGRPVEGRMRGVGHVYEKQVMRPAPAQEPGPDALLGIFKDQSLTVQLDRSALGGYTGEMRFNGQTFPLEAAGSADSLKGTFQSAGASFHFTATLAGDTLTLTTDGAVYRLQKAPGPASQP